MRRVRDEAVTAQWAILQVVDDPSKLAAFRAIPAVAAALDGFGDDEVLAAIEKLKGDDAAEQPQAGRLCQQRSWSRDQRHLKLPALTLNGRRRPG